MFKNDNVYITSIHDFNFIILNYYIKTLVFVSFWNIRWVKKFLEKNLFSSLILDKNFSLPSTRLPSIFLIIFIFKASFKNILVTVSCLTLLYTIYYLLAAEQWLAHITPRQFFYTAIHTYSAEVFFTVPFSFWTYKLGVPSSLKLRSECNFCWLWGGRG